MSSCYADDLYRCLPAGGQSRFMFWSTDSFSDQRRSASCFGVLRELEGLFFPVGLNRSGVAVQPSSSPSTMGQRYVSQIIFCGIFWIRPTTSRQLSQQRFPDFASVLEVQRWHQVCLPRTTDVCRRKTTSISPKTDV